MKIYIIESIRSDYESDFTFWSFLFKSFYLENVRFNMTKK